MGPKSPSEIKPPLTTWKFKLVCSKQSVILHLMVIILKSKELSTPEFQIDDGSDKKYMWDIFWKTNKNIGLNKRIGGNFSEKQINE